MASKVVLILFVAVVNSQWVKEMENDGLFEGDMILTPAQARDAQNGNLGYASTNHHHWPTTIYYDWESTRANNKGILDAIADYQKFTCLKFIKRTTQKDYMYFRQGRGGCSSGVGYFKGSGAHNINLGNGCTGKGTVLHEMAHRLGIYHEQSRPDRDNYVTINFENIRSSMAYNFKKQKESNIDYYNTQYDYRSVMHYPDWAFSSNRKPTITTKDPAMQKVIGNRRGFSEIDKIQINRMYKCVPVPSQQPTQAPTQPPSTNGYLFKHSGGRCIDVNSQNQLILSSACSTKFTLVNGQLTVAGKCAYPLSGNSNAYVNVKTACGHTFTKSDQSGDYFALKNGKYGKCIHPHRGSSRPAEGTRLVIYSGCSGTRLKFKMI